ncbi:VOC family protein [Streptomyces sp. NPDC053750]|uniref:VOC family protein n=1 Tax=Streptomyces sp. NPDC053750 TaxID=3365714 RepID=UPI0037D8C950
MGRFYQGLLGWPVRRAEPGWGEIGPSDSGAGLSFRTEPLFSRPRWPSSRTEQQMMTHLDIEVDALASAVEHALASGAILAGFQPQTDARPVRPGGPPVLPLHALRPGRLTGRARDAHPENDGRAAGPRR